MPEDRETRRLLFLIEERNSLLDFRRSLDTKISELDDNALTSLPEGIFRGLDKLYFL